MFSKYSLNEILFILDKINEDSEVFTLFGDALSVEEIKDIIKGIEIERLNTVFLTENNHIEIYAMDTDNEKLHYLAVLSVDGKNINDLNKDQRFTLNLYIDLSFYNNLDFIVINSMGIVFSKKEFNIAIAELKDLEIICISGSEVKGVQIQDGRFVLSSVELAKDVKTEN